MKIIYIAVMLVFYLFLMSCISGNSKIKASSTSEDNAILRCTIDDTVVNREEFEKFLKTLKEVPHTWFCAESTTGGETGYDAADWLGNIYEYRAISENSNNHWSIKKK